MAASFALFDWWTIKRCLRRDGRIGGGEGGGGDEEDEKEEGKRRWKKRSKRKQRRRGRRGGRGEENIYKESVFATLLMTVSM